MPDQTPPAYRAFLSYSHRDERYAARLHRRLETYRPPRSVRRETGFATRNPAGRLRPVFRDRDELASSASLSGLIQEALNRSEALIVVCSPAAVASRWVNEEIRYFRSVHPDRPVLAFVVGGDPGLDPLANPGQAALPLNLLLRDINAPSSGYGEPLAADARVEGDGFGMAFLKLAAGLFDVPFDRLRQREVRRRQQRLVMAAAVSLGLAGVFALLAWRATVARNEARAARAQAELELISERETREFLLSVFELADPSEARGAVVTVREVLDRAVERIDSTSFSRPAIRSRFLATMGQAYSRLGLNRRGAELLQDSLDALPRDSVTPETLAQAIDSHIELADVEFDMGDYAAAMDALDAMEEPGMAAAATLVQRARAANIRGDVQSYLEEDAEALKAYEQALSLLDGITPGREEGASIRSRSLGGLALLRHFAGDYAGAQRLYGEVVEILLPVFGEPHPDSIWALISWGSAAYSNGDTVTARESWQRALRISVQVIGEGNPEIATIKNNLGRLMLETGDYAEAEALLRDALAIDRQQRIEEFDDLAFTLHNLAMTRLAQGDGAEARALLEEGLAIAEAAGHRMRGPLLIGLADLDCSSGERETGALRAEQGLSAVLADYEAPDWRHDQARLAVAFCRSDDGAPVNVDLVDASYCRLIARWRDSGFFADQAHRLRRAIEPAPGACAGQDKQTPAR